MGSFFSRKKQVDPYANFSLGPPDHSSFKKVGGHTHGTDPMAALKSLAVDGGGGASGVGGAGGGASGASGVGASGTSGGGAGSVIPPGVPGQEDYASRRKSRRDGDGDGESEEEDYDSDDYKEEPHITRQ
eukprot:TRINITY_DN1516_c0_g1_i1.p1 TRINITY_DN1516_c0_g1~~TRINITY_DN1516_c0_g1_i1.p1  ORF type:complete len:130 (-),score=24.44 TRINITY_DN1516_c0_g1_i1:216-605(-)